MENSGAVVCVVVIAVIALGALGLAFVALREVRLARETSLNEIRQFAYWTSEAVDKAQNRLVEMAALRVVPRPVARPVPPRGSQSG